MQACETVHSEPRDTLERPAYRVNFWQPTAAGAWALDAHVLFDADDVQAVLRWAEAAAGGRRFEVFVEMDHEAAGPFSQPRTAGLVRLFGTDPNAEEGRVVPLGRFVRQGDDTDPA